MLLVFQSFFLEQSLLKPVLMEIESRSSRKEYTQVLAECHRIYCEQRLSLIRGIVHQRISEFAKKEALPSLTRSGCAYLMQVKQQQLQHCSSAWGRQVRPTTVTNHTAKINSNRTDAHWILLTV